MGTPVRMLVAGATGLVGREIAALARDGGHWVRSLSRDPARAQALRGRVDEVRIADATDPSALAYACDGIDVVVSALGAPVSPTASGRRSFDAVDRAGNLALLTEAVRAGVRAFVYVGVHGEDSYADTVYARAHTEVEAALRDSGMRFGIVRPTGVFGAFAEFVAMARRGRLPVIGSGTARTNPIHERDVAAAVLDAVVAEASIERDIGGPETLTRTRIAELAFEAVGRAPKPIHVPPAMMSATAWLWGLGNPRARDFLRFVVAASTHDCIAPPAGRHTLGPYLAALAADVRRAAA